ncbi:MAG: polyprenol monophosphomannose synthase [Methanoregula sp.]|nr:polyprenol monophosphomannose synthase [Methanoregula sp.]
MHYDLTVIIPTFNEEENIEKMVVTVDAICKAHDITEEILVVDDSSCDSTITNVKKLMADYPFLRLIIRTRNPGLSPSLYEGIINAKADLVQCIDCDFSHPPEKIPVFYHILKNEGYDMVIGSRYVKGGEVINWPILRMVLSSGAALLSRLLIPHVKDSGSGFFAINRHILAGTLLSPRGFRMGFEILGKAHWTRVREIPIVFKDREFGQSKLKGRIIYDFLIQCGSILHYNLIARKSNNIIRAWKLFLHG